MTWILGIGGSQHDWSSCLLGPNQEIMAIDEERVTRKKYGIGADLLAAESRKYLLQAKGITHRDIDHVVACDLVPPAFYYSFRDRINIIGHHLAHAYSAFMPSPFEEAAILIADNAGSRYGTDEAGNPIVETISYGVGHKNEINIFKRVEGIDVDLGNHEFCTTNSIGYFYRTVSILLGFYHSSKNNARISEDGKTMGLASYGTDKYVHQYLEFVDFGPEGDFKFNALTRELEQFTNRLLEEGDGQFQVRADIAFAAQKVVEEAMLHAARYLKKESGLKNLVLAGGVALNCVANGRLLRESGFEKLYIQPASGDNGIALGCALYGYYNLRTNGKPERFKMEHTYLGRDYEKDRLITALKSVADQESLEWSEPESLAEEVASMLMEEKVVALFQGRAEFGPRALGNRSIFADPRSRTMRDRLNLQVKKREWFRPFAPMVIQSKASEYFDLTTESPYMLIVAKVLKPDSIPSVTHVDGTARIQTVTKSSNPLCYRILEEFERRSGIPILLNTSFNIAGEPIVETPEDAIRAFLAMELDALVLGPYLVKKVSSKNL